MARRTVVVLAAVMALFLTTLAPAGAAAGDPDALPLHAAKYMDRSQRTTRAEAVADALRYDVLLGKERSYGPHLAAMKDANPDVVVLAYMNGTFAQSADEFPSDWYSRDSNGDIVRSKRWDNFMMDPLHPEWLRNRRQECKRFVDDLGFDGCVLDVLGPGPVMPGAFVDKEPINSATGRRWSIPEWLDAANALARHVKRGVSPAMVLANNLGDGAKYYDLNTKRLMRGIDGAMVEGFLRHGRGSDLTLHHTVADWERHVEMLRHAGKRGNRIFTVTKTWTDEGTAAEKERWRLFSLATFLMGSDGGHRWFFTSDEQGEPTAHPDWYDEQIGTPKGMYRERGNGVYQRNFTQAKVYANPHDDARTVRIPRGDARTIQGDPISGRVTLEPHSGLVIVWD